MSLKTTVCLSGVWIWLGSIMFSWPRLGLRRGRIERAGEGRLDVLRLDRVAVDRGDVVELGVGAQLDRPGDRVRRLGAQTEVGLESWSVMVNGSVLVLNWKTRLITVPGTA